MLFSPGPVPLDYARFLENRMRVAFCFEEVPIRSSSAAGGNGYGRRNSSAGLSPISRWNRWPARPGCHAPVAAARASKMIQSDQPVGNGWSKASTASWERPGL